MRSSLALGKGVVRLPGCTWVGEAATQLHAARQRQTCGLGIEGHRRAGGQAPATSNHQIHRQHMHMQPMRILRHLGSARPLSPPHLRETEVATDSKVQGQFHARHMDCIVTAPAPFCSTRGVRISTYATVGLHETANADSSIADRNQQHTNPQWSASQTHITASIAAAANV